MTQRLIQTQTQQQVQQQRITQQQMMLVRMLEMPLGELQESVNAELDDNPALETAEGEPTDDVAADSDTDEATDFDSQSEREERDAALDAALERLDSDEGMPVPTDYVPRDNADYEEMVYGDTTSFYDKLREQVAMEALTERQQDIMDYLIGSLDDDGLLRKPLDTISDELAIYHATEATTGEIEDVLHIMQTFDPAGIGARSLQECLLLQIDRREESRLTALMRSVVRDHYEEFTRKHWDKIQAALSLTDLQTDALRREILRLNPKPGASLGETEGRATQQITPDFIIDTADDGTITLTLCRGHVPELRVSREFADMVAGYREGGRQTMNRQQKEALLYAREKVDKARGYIQAIEQRQRTLRLTMQAIIDWQRRYLTDGDESELRPMILKDIARQTGLDISTVSRVVNVKWAQTRWGVVPLRFFFSDGYRSADGEETSTRSIKLALREVVDAEDKDSPLSDDALAQRMAQRGMPIARRTIAKYREQMGIPVARLRKG